MNATISIQQVKLRCYTSDPTSTYQIRLIRPEPDWMLKLETTTRPPGDTAMDVTWGSLAGEPLDSFTYVSLRRLLEAGLDVEMWKTGVGSPKKRRSSSNFSDGGGGKDRGRSSSSGASAGASKAVSFAATPGKKSEKLSATALRPPRAVPVPPGGIAAKNYPEGAEHAAPAPSSRATILKVPGNNTNLISGGTRAEDASSSSAFAAAPKNSKTHLFPAVAGSNVAAGYEVEVDDPAMDDLDEQEQNVDVPKSSPFTLQHQKILTDRWEFSKLALLKAFELTRFIIRIEMDEFVGQLIVKLCWHWLQIELPQSKLHEEKKKQKIPPRVRAQIREQEVRDKVESLGMNSSSTVAAGAGDAAREQSTEEGLKEARTCIGALGGTGRNYLSAAVGQERSEVKKIMPSSVQPLLGGAFSNDASASTGQQGRERAKTAAGGSSSSADGFGRSSKQYAERVDPRQLPPKVRAAAMRRNARPDPPPKQPLNMAHEWRREFVTRNEAQNFTNRGGAATVFDQPLSPRSRMHREAGFEPFDSSASSGPVVGGDVEGHAATKHRNAFTATQPLSMRNKAKVGNQSKMGTTRSVSVKSKNEQRRLNEEREVKLRREEQKEVLLRQLRKGVIQMRLDLDKMQPTILRTTTFFPEEPQTPTDDG
ncbi:unnamed protein product [Amoebophrya sp. A120]|nr:unnamed protein product [Amoebophrya sp. A120]|eukprot:GSA120T00011327001.1